MVLIIFVIPFLSSTQDPKKPIAKKFLFIIGKTQKHWNQTEFRDSINYPMVESIQYIPDSVAVLKYGKKGKNGVYIIKYKNTSKTDTTDHNIRFFNIPQ